LIKQQNLIAIIFESRYHFWFVWTHVSLTSVCLWVSFCSSLFSHLRLLMSCTKLSICTDQTPR
jgi:hypothetical protein